jgi:hypothetical protein
MAYTYIIDPVFFIGVTSIVLQQTLSSHSFPLNIFFCLILLVKEKTRKRTLNIIRINVRVYLLSFCSFLFTSKGEKILIHLNVFSFFLLLFPFFPFVLNGAYLVLSSFIKQCCM